jgi:hypothetical protein
MFLSFLQVLAENGARSELNYSYLLDFYLVDSPLA